MILTDGIHLVSDSSLAELHKFARKMGLKREWFQDHKKYPHYDLTTKKALLRAIRLNADYVGKKELLDRMVKTDEGYSEVLLINARLAEQK